METDSDTQSRLTGTAQANKRKKTMLSALFKAFHRKKMCGKF